MQRLGGNSLIPAYYKYDEQAEKLVNFLKHGPDGNGVLNVDIFALERENAPADKALVAPLGLTAFPVAAGETFVADVVVQNKGIAHTLVPEQRDFYESWINFTVKDASGKVLFEMEGVTRDVAEAAMRLAAHKLPMKTKFVSREHVE